MSFKLIRGYLNILLYKIGGIFGLLVLTKKRYTGKPYEQLLPSANFAPWKKDEAFKSVFERMKKNTLVDQYRCYELWMLIRQTQFMNGAYLEVGVWRGGTGALIAKSAELSGVQEKVYLCDTFSGVVKAGVHDSDYDGGEHADTNKKIVEDLTRHLNLKNVVILEGIFPDETGDSIADNKFRFCHIDVDVYESAKGIFQWVWPKLVSGGIVVFDDYGFDTCDGITKYVNEEMFQKDRTFIYNLNGHAVIVKH